MAPRLEVVALRSGIYARSHMRLCACACALGASERTARYLKREACALCVSVCLLRKHVHREHMYCVARVCLVRKRERWAWYVRRQAWLLQFPHNDTGQRKARSPREFCAKNTRSHRQRRPLTLAASESPLRRALHLCQSGHCNCLGRPLLFRREGSVNTQFLALFQKVGIHQHRY